VPTGVDTSRRWAFLLALLAFPLLASLGSCRASRPSAEDSGPRPPPARSGQPGPRGAPPAPAARSEGEELRETVALLAGLELPAGSPLRELAARSEHRSYRAQLAASFRRFRERQLLPIARFRARHLESTSARKLFYPMGGPDVANPLAFFPDARELLLIGLEPPGPIPIARQLPEDELGRWLEGAQTALRTLFAKNLFRSRELKQDQRESPLAAVPALVLIQLALTGHEPLALEAIRVDLKGRALPSRGERRPAGHWSGFELRFRRRGEPGERRLRYLRLDLSDRTLLSHPELLDGLLGAGELTTIFKAASYLPARPDFSALRALVLGRSQLVLEDDSGIPLRELARTRWRLEVFGRYRVIRRFARHFQPELAGLIRERGGSALPFAYGYGFAPETSHLIIARRR
jgi:hypothetical protein